jgi:hypothetical protein
MIVADVASIYEGADSCLLYVFGSDSATSGLLGVKKGGVSDCFETPLSYFANCLRKLQDICQFVGVSDPPVRGGLHFPFI